MSDPAAETPLTGLTQQEVEERVRAGRTNANTDVKTKSVRQILAEHTFTLFNGVMLVLAVLVAITGAYRNALFVLTVVLNLGIGVFQEIRSKRSIDKLSVLAARDARVIRDGRETTVPLEGIVIDDLVRLSRGDQVPADSVVVQGFARVDESLLTGESVAIEKHPGDELMSGSFLDSGGVVCRVARVGADGFAARINAEAKQGKAAISEILTSLNLVIRAATVMLAPVGLLLFARTMMGGYTWDAAILSTVSALVGMIPQGLVLLTSSVFAIAATRLAARKVLVQQIYCVETLARVDVLCLDKTGTITTGEMEVTHVVPMDDHTTEPELTQLLATIVEANAADVNDTGRAILAYAMGAGAEALPVSRGIPFSSSTKSSGCVTADGRCLKMGAGQFVLGQAYALVEDRVHDFGDMARVLVVAEVPAFDEAGEAQGAPTLLGLVVLRDQIRDTASATIAYFDEQGVDCRVISGDDPATVSAIAQRVGVRGAEEYVDMSRVPDDPASLDELVARCHVFGRVTPDQKRELVRAFKRAGHTVAMTGDGVNDVLALREADCSVAMAAGSDAARNIAELVLVDNDFAHMPEVVAQGRQSINNLQRSAALFLVKTVFSAVIAVVCALLPPYPFLPVQMTLLSTAVIGVPSFVLALEPNHDRVTGSFLRNVLGRSLPASLGIILGLVAVVVGARIAGWDQELLSTYAMYVVAVVGVALIVRISIPFTLLRRALLVVVVGIMVVGCGVFGDFFSVVALEGAQWATIGLVCAASVAAYLGCDRWFSANGGDDGPAGRIVQFIGGKHE